jgi:hypothetical protein
MWFLEKNRYYPFICVSRNEASTQYLQQGLALAKLCTRRFAWLGFVHPQEL